MIGDINGLSFLVNWRNATVGVGFCILNSIDPGVVEIEDRGIVNLYLVFWFSELRIYLVHSLFK